MPELMYSRSCEMVCEDSMGVAPGGLMRQEIYEDEYGIEAWDTQNASRCFVHVMNSEQWSEATGTSAPGKPPSAKEYTNAGLPWFEFYSESSTAVKGSKKLAGLDSVGTKTIKDGKAPLTGNEDIGKPSVIQIPEQKNMVSEDKW